jgi:hypothetical protein
LLRVIACAVGGGVIRPFLEHDAALLPVLTGSATIKQGRRLRQEGAKSAGANSRRTDVTPGDAAFVITASAWLKGYNITQQRNSADATRAMEIAEKCL